MSTLTVVKSIQPASSMQSTFAINMAAMRSFYKEGTLSGATHTFSLPISVLNFGPIVLQDNPASVALKQASVAAAAANQAIAQDIRANVMAALALLQATGDTSAFNQQLEQAKAVAKIESDGNIDNFFATIETVGNQYPASQPIILNGANSTGSFISNFLSGVGSFIQSIYNAVVNAINAAIQWIEQAGESVANWVSGAVQSVENFFSNLF